jgi:hypothetical protein
MNYSVQLTNLIMANLQYIILGLTALIFIALIIFVNINLKLGKLNKRYQRMMRGMEGANLESLLLGHIEDVRQAVSRVDKLDQDCRRLDENLRLCVQRVGIVRFNAFEDTGSDLSFAVAMLDAKSNGVVISSIFGRNDSRIYAKPVVGGQSAYFLTDEEKEALLKAQQQENNTKG